MVNYYSAVDRNAFEPILERLVKQESLLQNEVVRKRNADPV